MSTIPPSSHLTIGVDRRVVLQSADRQKVYGLICSLYRQDGQRGRDQIFLPVHYPVMENKGKVSVNLPDVNGNYKKYCEIKEDRGFCFLT